MHYYSIEMILHILQSKGKLAPSGTWFKKDEDGRLVIEGCYDKPTVAASYARDKRSQPGGRSYKDCSVEIRIKLPKAHC